MFPRETGEKHESHSQHIPLRNSKRWRTEYETTKLCIFVQVSRSDLKRVITNATDIPHKAKVKSY
jgi:hypothetical protein